MPGLFAVAAFDAIVVVAATVLLVLALRAGFWLEKKMFIGMLASLSVGAALGTTFWALRGTGYQVFGNTGTGVQVSGEVVEILGRLANLVLLLVFVLFAWVLMEAILGTFFTNSRVPSLVLLIVFVVVTVVTVAYSLTMAIYSSLATELFLINASAQVVAAVSFFFSVVLAIMWLAAWRLLVTKRVDGVSFDKMRRNSVVFFFGSSVLAALFLAQFVVSVLYLTVSWETYELAWLGLDVASHVLTVLAVLACVGAAVIVATRGKIAANPKTASVVPLLENETSSRAVPERYQDF